MSVFQNLLLALVAGSGQHRSSLPWHQESDVRYHERFFCYPGYGRMQGMKTTWNLQLLYKNPKDPKIEKDMKVIELACDRFAKKWAKNPLYVTDKKILLKALHDYETLEDTIKGPKPLIYLCLARDLNTNNTSYSAIINKMQDRLAKASNKIIFFSLKLGYIEKNLQRKLLADKDFSQYRYFLATVFKTAKYKLSEPEEKILSLKSQPGYQLWVAMNEKAIGRLSVFWKGKKLPIHQAGGMVPTLPRGERAKLSKLINDQYRSITATAEAELNAVIIDKKIDDELRGLQHPYSATVLDYENTETEVMNLVDAVQKTYSIPHRLYRLKARLMGLKKLAPYDLAVMLQSSKKKFTFEQGVEIIKSAFGKADPQYVKIFERFLANGQIDVYPKQGKRGGGYCWGGHGRPTYILLNWSDDFDSVATLAHEMGHAIHTELSKSQPIFYEDYSTSTAEVASTLFENFVYDELIQRLPEKERIYVQFNRLQDAMMVIHRQIAHFQFEQEIHAGVRSKGQLSTEEFTKMRQKNWQTCVGDSVKFSPNDGLGWVAHVHLRYFFYVYSYAYGQLISTVLYTKYKKDPRFIKKINEALSAGRSKSPYEIFKSIGIDTSKKSFWMDGLKSIEEDIKKLEKMAVKLQKKK